MLMVFFECVHYGILNGQLTRVLHFLFLLQVVNNVLSKRERALTQQRFRVMNSVLCQWDALRSKDSPASKRTQLRQPPNSTQ